MSTFYQLIVEAMEDEQHEDMMSDIIAIYPHDFDLSKEVPDRVGKSCFTVWTQDRVYFPATYDGDFWVVSVPRNPSKEATHPVGG